MPQRKGSDRFKSEIFDSINPVIYCRKIMSLFHWKMSDFLLFLNAQFSDEKNYVCLVFFTENKL